MRKIYMVVGCPGSGKSWVTEQLKDKFSHIRHDDFVGKGADAYLKEIVKQTKGEGKPLLIESPFSIRQLKDPLEKNGAKVECVFIQEKNGVIEDRYQTRESKPIPQGHLTRQQTYAERASEYKSFYGTSQQVLDYLKDKDEPQGGET